MNGIRSIKYIGERSGFFEFASSISKSLYKKNEQGKMCDTFLFVIGTVDGKDIFELKFVKRLPGETLRRTGVRIELFDAKILSEPLSISEWEQIRNESFKQVEKYHFIRIGQALFNNLSDNYPELADTIRGTDVDPFQIKDYTHPKIKAFYDKIVKNGE